MIFFVFYQKYKMVTTTEHRVLPKDHKWNWKKKCSETINLIEANLYMNNHWMIPCKINLIFVNLKSNITATVMVKIIWPNPHDAHNTEVH